MQHLVHKTVSHAFLQVSSKEHTSQRSRASNNECTSDTFNIRAEKDTHTDAAVAASAALALRHICSNL